MWIPGPVYESIPYASAALGVALLAAAFLVQGGPRELLFVAGGVAVTAGLVLWMKRRDYRSTQARYDRHSLDE